GTDLFLSGRSRHTSSDRDWSSDVCSSDLCTPGCAAGAVLPGEDSPGSASGCALTIRFIEPWRYSSTSRERCRATAENPIFCSKRSEERRVGNEWGRGRSRLCRDQLAGGAR